MKINKLYLFFLLCMMLVSTSYAENIQFNKNIIIFVSFSMSNDSLKGWMKEAEMIHAPLVIRGLINNSFKETINRIGELTKDNHGGLQIDPTLFERFDVKKVPAVVVVKDNNCIPTMSCSLDYDIVYGDVTLTYALNKIANQNDDLSSIANRALTQLREVRHG